MPTQEELERIYSNDYADLLIEYRGDESVLQQFSDATVQIIDYFFAVVRVPIQKITDFTIAQLGYYVIPKLSGLTSSNSLEKSGIIKTRNMPTLNLRGKGVLIGILDTGIDYTNPIFKNADNTTKIAALWDQTILINNSTNTYYGTEFTREQINQALNSNNPYDIVSSKDEIGHGTMVAGIAAGNEVPDHGFYGIAPDAELVVVKLKPAKPYLKEFWRLPSDAVCYQENDILFALEYLEQVAIRLNQPMSICVALGSSLGAHDNSAPLTFNLSVRSQNLNFAVVVAGGNEGNKRRHYYGVIDPKIGYDKVELNVGENESGFSLELWGDSPGLFAIDIKTPSGEYIPKMIPRKNDHFSSSFIFEPTQILIDYQTVESRSGDQLILLRFTKPSPGIWTFNVYGKGDLSLSFHIWLPMNNFITDNTFFLKSNPYTTIISLGNAIDPITVAAYNDMDDSLYADGSKGYTRTDVVKPEITAPGINITCPTLDQGFADMTGTSLAAAHTSGVAAMLLEWGLLRGNLKSVNTADIKFLMIRGARRNIGLTYPNRDWGYGILDVYNIFNTLRESL